MDQRDGLTVEVTVTEKEQEKSQRRFLKYTFFKLAREWRSLEEATKEEAREEFLDLIARRSEPIQMRLYSLVGIRGDVDFMVWLVAEQLDQVQEFISEILKTRIGKYLEVPYSYLAMSKKSSYLGSHTHAGQEGENKAPRRRGGRYLFVYPLVKKRGWYRLPFKDRQRIMAQHFMIGHRYPKIKINTGYSFGLDDQEFVLAFEGDDPAEFLDLVEELRGSEASAYTQLETPIFTCAAIEPKELLDQLG